MAPVTTLLVFGLAALPAILAHPGHVVAEEAAERSGFMKRSPATVRSCANQLKRRGLVDGALLRRQEMAREARNTRGLNSVLTRRDFSTYNFTHEASDITYGDDETLLFADNSTCLLQPEVTEGPYYVDGELIRSNLTENQEGVPLYLDVQLIDTNTCEPIPAIYMDLWHCNATGVYSGVSSGGNGDDSDDVNLDATFLRGIVQTDINGVAQYQTIFPGHYTGRATHIHVLSHNVNETTVRTNGTLLGTNGTAHASHIGQFFFDQDLISLVEATAPYTDNTQELTTNEDDDILAEETENMDPFVEWIMLGDDITHGVMAWISIGIDSTYDRELTPAATMYESGGVANENAMSAPGSSDESNGTMPSGGDAPVSSATV